MAQATQTNPATQSARQGEKPGIRLFLLGRAALYVNGQEHNICHRGLKKPWELFCFLAANRGRHLTCGDIIRMTSGGEENQDARNALKNNVMRLRREFAAICGDDTVQPVVYAADGYAIAQELLLEADFLFFDELYHRIGRMQNPKPEELLQWYRVLFDQYAGHFFCTEKSAMWMRLMKIELAAKYEESVHNCCELLMQKHMYRPLLELFDETSRHCPPCDEWVRYRYRAMYALGMYEGIASLYAKTTAEFRALKKLDGAVYRELTAIVQTAHRRRQEGHAPQEK